MGAVLFLDVGEHLHVVRADHPPVAQQLAGTAFDQALIGHMGDLNEPMLLGCLATTELAMKASGVPFVAGGVDAAIESLAA